MGARAEVAPTSPPVQRRYTAGTATPRQTGTRLPPLPPCPPAAPRPATYRLSPPWGRIWAAWRRGADGGGRSRCLTQLWRRKRKRPHGGGGYTRQDLARGPDRSRHGGGGGVMAGRGLSWRGGRGAAWRRGAVSGAGPGAMGWGGEGRGGDGGPPAEGASGGSGRVLEGLLLLSAAWGRR